ncbi:MAG TPA: hypothetical protein PK800_01390 [Syntrophorhabdaceae bacterium]|nr:hypothetical protein [Syntrophorhabdaceae bacterium]
MFRVYKIKETDLNKIRIPKNYMLVRRPFEDTLFLWEIPIKTESSESEGKIDEKRGTISPSPVVDSSSIKELSKQLSIGEIKGGPAQKIIQDLLNKTH